MKKAFTLVEILIVLVVIGILLSVLLPTVKNIKANEKVVKFKKGHNTLLNAVQELVISDKYYIPGDLGVKPNGQLVSDHIEENHKYFMQTFSDVLSVNYNSPKVGKLSNASYFAVFPVDCLASAASGITGVLNSCTNQVVTSSSYNSAKDKPNNPCLNTTSANAMQVIANGIWYWDPHPDGTFGIPEFDGGTGRRLFTLKDANGNYPLYKFFCMDIDGVPSGANKDNCINECPFWYGINIEGKIFTSKQVDQWLEKSASK